MNEHKRRRFCSSYSALCWWSPSRSMDAEHAHAPRLCAAVCGVVGSVTLRSSEICPKARCERSQQNPGQAYLEGQKYRLYHMRFHKVVSPALRTQLILPFGSWARALAPYLRPPIRCRHAVAAWRGTNDKWLTRRELTTEGVVVTVFRKE